MHFGKRVTSIMLLALAVMASAVASGTATAASRVEIVVTFLALLELIRLKQVRAVQNNPFDEIEIAPATN